MCSFGTNFVPGTYDVTRGEVRCLAPTATAVGIVPVMLSLNAQQYAPVGTYTYHAPIELDALDPVSGPALGATTVEVAGFPFLSALLLELGSGVVRSLGITSDSTRFPRLLSKASAGRRTLEGDLDHDLGGKLHSIFEELFQYMPRGF